MRTVKFIYGCSQLLVSSCLVTLWFRNICTSNRNLSLHLGSWVLCKCEKSKFKIKMSWRNSFLGILPVLFPRVTLSFRLEKYFPFLINTSVGWSVYFVHVYIKTSPFLPLWRTPPWTTLGQSQWWADQCSPLPLIAHEDHGADMFQTLAIFLYVTKKPRKWPANIWKTGFQEDLSPENTGLFLGL